MQAPQKLSFPEGDLNIQVPLEHSSSPSNSPVLNGILEFTILKWNFLGHFRQKVLAEEAFRQLVAAGPRPLRGLSGWRCLRGSLLLDRPGRIPSKWGDHLG